MEQQEEKCLDLDALRLERLGDAKPPPIIRFGGKNIALPSELPYELLILNSSKNPEDNVRLLKVLFGEAYDFIIDQHPTIHDVRNIMDGIWKLYDLDPDALGEDSASTPPLESTSLS